jgi:cephalosporin hydroxylase
MSPRREPLPIESYRKRGSQLAYRPRHAFFELADRVVSDERTLLRYDRLYVLWQAAANVKSVPGAVAEIGSYRGGSAFFIASAVIHHAGAEVPMHVFDTFEGHPADAIT